MASASKKADGAGKPPQPPPLEMIPIPWPLPKELPAELRAVYLPPTPVIGGAVPVGVRYSASTLMLISVWPCTHDGLCINPGNEQDSRPTAVSAALRRRCVQLSEPGLFFLLAYRLWDMQVYTGTMV